MHPAVFLFGLVAKEPKQYLRLHRIRRKIYRTVAPLRTEIIKSREPIDFADLDESAFRRVRPGARWGTTLDSAWLHVTGTVPAGETRSLVMLGIDGEGLIYTPAGEAIDTISTVFQQGDLPHSGRKFRPIDRVDTTSGTIDFYADLGYNGWVLYPIGHGVFRGAHLAVRDDDAFGLYYDYLTLIALAQATDDPVLEPQLRRTLDRAWSKFAGGDIRGARDILAVPLAEKSETEFVYTSIGHGHLDQAWLWPWRETRRKAARTYTRQLNNIEDYEGFVYGTSQPQQLQWTKETHPEVYERIKKAVAAGRMELQGSFWVETDTNMPGGESLVRQSLVGRRFFAEEFGQTADDMRLCWLPDTFGYSGNLPQILKKSGMDWFQTIKLSWNKVTVFPHRSFHWEGIDGSSVLVHMPPEGDYNSRGAADGLLSGLAKYPERALNTALLVYGSGDGGGGPGEIHLEVTKREHSLRGLPQVKYGTASDFFRKLEQLDVPHTHRGELYLETHQGTYTTQAQVKYRNRRVERKLHEAEALAVFAGEDSGPVLVQHWRDLLLNHFHDILPGSSITRVNREANAVFQRLEDSADAYATELTALLPHSGAELSALNLTSMARTEHVEIDGTWYAAQVEPYASARLTRTGAFPELGFDDESLTNGELTVRFGRSGEIVSCLDANGNEHAADGFNRIVLHRDPYQFPFDAWDIGQKYTQRTPRTLRPSAVSSSIDGPRVIRTQAYRWGRGEIEQRVILEAGSNLVRFETRVDWREKHRMLRAEFRPSRFGDIVKCEIQFGHIDRVTTELNDVQRAQFEVCAHKWIATEDAHGGFALLNDGKYGHRAKDGLISLNLLRAPTFPDKLADRGIHHFTYAFRPYETDDLVGVIRDGYRLNNPLSIAPGVVLPSVAAVDNPGVIIETIKRAERGGGIVLRLYESLGQSTTTALRVALPYDSARESDLMELPIGSVDLDRLEFSPFEIKTILLESTGAVETSRQ